MCRKRAVIIAMFLVLGAVVWLLVEWLRLFWPRLPFWAAMPALLLPPFTLALSYSTHRRGLKIFLHNVGELCAGAYIYLTLVTVFLAAVFGLMRLVGAIPAGWLSANRKLAGGAVLLAAAAVYICGAVNACFLRVVRYSVRMRGVPAGESMRVVCFSDLHLGITTGPNMARRIARRTNSLCPDAVCIAGDIFDLDRGCLLWGGRTLHALGSIKSKYGVFACLGNHDILIDDQRKDAFIRGAGIRVLADERAQAGWLTIVGRRDLRETARMGERELLDGAVAPILAIDHQPPRWRQLVAAGAGLVLCGHTHNGQTFPGNVIARRIFAASYGRYDADGGCAIVTSGAGFWGPPLRVGTFNEIVCIDITGE